MVTFLYLCLPIYGFTCIALSGIFLANISETFEDIKNNGLRIKHIVLPIVFLPTTLIVSFILFYGLLVISAIRLYEKTNFLNKIVYKRKRKKGDFYYIEDGKKIYI